MIERKTQLTEKKCQFVQPEEKRTENECEWRHQRDNHHDKINSAIIKILIVCTCTLYIAE